MEHVMQQLVLTDLSDLTHCLPKVGLSALYMFNFVLIAYFDSSQGKVFKKIH